MDDPRAGEADDRPDDPLEGAALPEDPEERGWADLPVLAPPLPALVYPPPLTTRPLVEPVTFSPAPLPRRLTTMIRLPYPPNPELYPPKPYPPNPELYPPKPYPP